MKYEFHPEAELELYEAALRYEAQVPELGRQFGKEVKRVVHLLLEHPEMGAHVDENLRHFVLRKFPFSVVYAVASDLIYGHSDLLARTVASLRLGRSTG